MGPMGRYLVMADLPPARGSSIFLGTYAHHSSSARSIAKTVTIESLSLYKVHRSVAYHTILAQHILLPHCAQEGLRVRIEVENRTPMCVSAYPDLAAYIPYPNHSHDQQESNQCNLRQQNSGRPKVPNCRFHTQQTPRHLRRQESG